MREVGRQPAATRRARQHSPASLPRTPTRTSELFRARPAASFARHVSGRGRPRARSGCGTSARHGSDRGTPRARNGTAFAAGAPFPSHPSCVHSVAVAVLVGGACTGLGPARSSIERSFLRRVLYRWGGGGAASIIWVRSARSFVGRVVAVRDPRPRRSSGCSGGPRRERRRPGSIRSRSPETAAVGCASARSLVAWRGSAIPPTPSSMRAAVSTVTPPPSVAAGTRTVAPSSAAAPPPSTHCWHEELHLRCPPLRLRHQPLRLMLLQKFRYQVQCYIVVRKVAIRLEIHAVLIYVVIPSELRLGVELVHCNNMYRTDR